MCVCVCGRGGILWDQRMSGGVCECARGGRGERGGTYGRVSAVKIQGCEPLSPPLRTCVDLNQLRSELEQVLSI